MFSRHPLALAAFASLVAHAVLAVGLAWSSSQAGWEREADRTVDVDLEIAPPAPQGFDPVEPSAAILVQESSLDPTLEAASPSGGEAGMAVQETSTTLEPEPEEEEGEEAAARKRAAREKEKKKRDEARRRAEENAAQEEDEHEDESAASKNQSPPDAGPPEEQTATSSSERFADGGALVSGGTAPASSSPDAGGEAPSPLARAAALFGRAAGIAHTETDGASPETNDANPIVLPPGASADLRTYAPQGDKIAVLLRYDRLRGTPWSALADAIIAPMPDYRSIVGHRKVELAELFRSLLISSRNPTKVWATSLVARTHLSSGELRRFLDHPLQHVTWQSVRGGVLGRREPSGVKLDSDHRVYLMPSPGLVVLTASRHLGVLVEPSPTAASRRELDMVRAAEADLPLWLARARLVENEAGTSSDVVAVVTVGGLKRAELDLPEVGKLPTPERFSLALEMAKVGFYVRGTLAFASPDLAERFDVHLNDARARLLGSSFGQLMLKNLHAFHALKGLTLRRRGPLVTYATSISNADAKAGMRLAAEWARRFFEVPPEPARDGSGAPKNGAEVPGRHEGHTAPDHETLTGVKPAEPKPGSATPPHSPANSSSTRQPPIHPPAIHPPAIEPRP